MFISSASVSCVRLFFQSFFHFSCVCSFLPWAIVSILKLNRARHWCPTLNLCMRCLFNVCVFLSACVAGFVYKSSTFGVPSIQRLVFYVFRFLAFFLPWHVRSQELDPRGHWCPTLQDSFARAQPLRSLVSNTWVLRFSYFGVFSALARSFTRAGPPICSFLPSVFRLVYKGSTVGALLSHAFSYECVLFTLFVLLCLYFFRLVYKSSTSEGHGLQDALFFVSMWWLTNVCLLSFLSFLFRFVCEGLVLVGGLVSDALLLMLSFINVCLFLPSEIRLQELDL